MLLATQQKRFFSPEDGHMAYPYHDITDPGLLSFYVGWTGQRVAWCVHVAVEADDAGLWREACREFDRMLVLLDGRDPLQASILASLSTLMDLLVIDGGWWTSPGGFEERYPGDVDAVERDRAVEDVLDRRPFAPYLDCGAGDVPLGRDVAEPLAGLVSGLAEVLAQRDACRLATLLCGLCYRVNDELSVQAIQAGLDGLADLQMTDLAKENVLRRHLGLSELGEGRTYRSTSGTSAGKGGITSEPTPRTVNPFEPHVETLAPEPMVLNMVFDTLGLRVPPQVSDTDLFDMEAVRRDLRSKITEHAQKESGNSSFGPGGRGAVPDTMHTEEAIQYLGFDRLGLARPEMRLQRLVKNRVLHPTKVGGRNVYRREELDRVLREGDKPKRGRKKRN